MQTFPWLGLTRTFVGSKPTDDLCISEYSFNGILGLW